MRLKLGIRSKDKKLSTEAGRLESNSEPAYKGSPCFAGSKDEAFFDTQTWLYSDSEDDFVSVTGDFVPSRGSTPNYQISTNVIFQLDNISSANTCTESKSEATPTDAKRRLSELLQESQDEMVVKHDYANGKFEVNAKSNICKVETSSPCRNDENPDKDVDHHKEKTIKTTQCCLPSLPRSISFRERKNRRA